jgi:hypothetical protein
VKEAKDENIVKKDEVFAHLNLLNNTESGFGDGKYG